jgi:hypothetical protein
VVFKIQIQIQNILFLFLGAMLVWIHCIHIAARVVMDGKYSVGLTLILFASVGSTDFLPNGVHKERKATSS